MNSKRIAPVGKYSNAYGKAKVADQSYIQIPKRPLESKEEDIKLKEQKEENDIAEIYQKLKEKEAQFEIKLKTQDLKIKKMGGDGNCLFRAISDQIYGTEEHHLELRNWCMSYIVQEKEFFSQYIVGGTSAFSGYVANKRLSGEWGDDIEIEAFSEIYGCPIEIYAYDDKPMRTFHENTIIKEGQRPITLSYHGRSHYNSVSELLF